MNSEEKLNTDIKELLKDGIDKNSFRFFYQYTFDFVFKTAFFYLKNKEIADEVVSDVFVKLWDKKNEFYKIKNFKSYIYITTKNLALNCLAKNKIDFSDKIPEDYKDEFNSPEYSAESKELNTIIEQTINTLPIKSKEVFYLIKEEGLKYSEVAEILKVPVKTVDSRLYNAIKIIREQVEKYYKN